jgi:3',5'-cyclic AMP phosphodiesterase CpdA
LTIRIAHLSDLHFGDRFELGLWRDVAHAVVDFAPQVLVVSGDLVDHPAPAHLLAAKCELRTLASDAGAELCVVPGNHDLLEYGSGVVQRRHDWYPRIFGTDDTAAAEAALAQELGVAALGFSATARDGASVWSAIKTRLFGDPKFARTIPSDPPAPKLVWSRPGLPILCALLDSTPGGPGDLATGLVSDDALRRLAAELDAINTPCLARIAVVHHHVLPVAYAGAAHDRQESVMVLRNAGTVLRVLADQRFDLVLHGHWHRPQCARLDFATAAGAAYPITVAAAGSAAMKTPDPRGNSFNLIEIEESGRITVWPVFYGGAQAPRWRESQDAPRYREPTEAVKRRAFVRAGERHPLECALRRQEFKITENGDLWITQAYEGLRRTGSGRGRLDRRRHVLRPLPHGRFVRRTLRLAAASAAAGYKLAVDAPAGLPPGAQRCIVRLPAPLTHAPSPGYELSYAVANTIAMTRWEAAEQLRRGGETVLAADGEREWVGVSITHPTRKLSLSVQLPPGAGLLGPYVRCFRRREGTGPEIDEFGDADPLAGAGAEELLPDEEAAEDARLRFDAGRRAWVLEVCEPMVGTLYQLCWDLPGPDPGEVAGGPRVEGQTAEARRLLLELGQRIAAGEADAADRKAIDTFDLLRTAIEEQFGTGRKREHHSVELWAYDAEQIALVPVLSHRSWSSKPWPLSFVIPLGDGVAGAAFQQRRIIPWGSGVGPDSLIEPVDDVPRPDERRVVMKHILAIPLYHPTMADHERPPPWATIGVLSFGSSSDASRLADLGGQHPDRAVWEKALGAWTFAQGLLAAIVEALQ